MNSRKKSALTGLALMLLGVTGTAGATIVTEFNSTAVGAFGPGPYGSVTLEQNGTSVDVTVALRSDLNFVNTGGPHAVFSFNATGVAVGDISNVLFNGASNTNYTIVTSGVNTPFGTFDFLIDCTGGGCENGAPGQQIDPLTFTVANALEDDLKKLNTANAYYAADVICVSGSCNGATGGIGAVPEPGMLGLVGLGLLGFGAIRKLRT